MSVPIPAALLSWRHAVIPAVINFLINVTTAWFAFRERASVPISVDQISAQTHTVWSQGVSMAFTLGLILTVINWKVFTAEIRRLHPELLGRVERPLFPAVAGIALRNTLTVFGSFMVLAVLWQRSIGQVDVLPLLAAVLVGLLGATITSIVALRTRRELLSGD